LLAINKASLDVRVDTRPAPLHLEGADALRALATVAVVVVHTSAWPLQDAGADRLVWSWVDLASRFCVPAFVVLSGLLIGLRGGGGRRGPWVRRRLRRTLLPWAVWAPVYCVLGLWLTGDIDGDGLAGWLLGGGGHLYFLLLVPQLYAVSLLWPKRLGPALGLAAGAMAAQLALDTLRLSGPMPPTLERLALWKGYELFPFWIGYLGVGIGAGRLLAAHRDRADHPRAALACLAAIPPALALLLARPADGLPHGDFATGTGAFLRPALVPLVLAVCAAVVLGAPRPLRDRPWMRHALRALSRDSLGVYITHPVIAYLVGHFLLASMLQRSLPVSVAGFVLLTGATLALAIVATRLLAASPFGAAIGAPSRRGRAARPR
jgi:peptidoglycan/LPS O-acetylase OafA/YrhL